MTADAAGGTTASTTGTQTTSDPVVGSSQQGGGDLQAALARAEKAEKEAAALRQAQAQSSAQAQVEAKRKQEAERLEAGDHKQVLEQRSAELEAATKRLAELEAAAQKRLDASIAKLPDTEKQRLELIRESLSIEKAQEYVDATLEAAGMMTGATNDPKTDKPRPKAPPPMHVATRSTKDGEDRVHPETRALFRRLSAPQSVVEMAEHVRGRSIAARAPDAADPEPMVGDHVFRLHGWTGQGTIKEINEHDTAVWIDNLRAMSPAPRTIEARESMKRMEEAAKARGGW